MKEKKFYVTYRTPVLAPTPIGVPKLIEIHRAIECPDGNTLMWCAFDMIGRAAIKNVRINRCGRVAKGTTIHSYEDYRAGNFGL